MIYITPEFIIVTEFFCRFCGVKTGEHRREFWMNTPQFEDVRCSACQAVYGTYQEMEQHYWREINGDADEFKEIIAKSEYQLERFIKEIEKIKQKRAKAQKKETKHKKV